MVVGAAVNVLRLASTVSGGNKGPKIKIPTPTGLLRSGVSSLKYLNPDNLQKLAKKGAHKGLKTFSPMLKRKIASTIQNSASKLSNSIVDGAIKQTGSGVRGRSGNVPKQMRF